LELALSRFNAMYGRSSLEDKLIDIAIVLESTLLHHTRDELKYRLSLRGAHLLKSARDPAETSDLLKKLYDERSEIVHNAAPVSHQLLVGESAPRKLSAQQFVAELEAICREVLRAFVRRIGDGQSLQDITMALDEQALMG
jgi:hypothetical protein